MRVLALPDVAGDRLVEGQVREAVPAVQVRGAEVDPEPAGDLAVDRPGAAVCGRRARLLFGRQALHLHVRIHDRVERPRHLRADPRQPFVDEPQDLRAPRVALGEP